MVASITQEDAEKIRANLQAHGRPVPAGLVAPEVSAGTPGVVSRRRTKPADDLDGDEPVTEDDVRRARAESSPRKPAGGAPRAAAASRPSSSARRRNGRRRTGGRSWRSRARRTITRATTGTSGGLLLTVMVYPLLLATIQHGAAGPGIWLRAKFLNIQGPASVTSGGPGSNGGLAPAFSPPPASTAPMPTYPANSPGAGTYTPMFAQLFTPPATPAPAAAAPLPRGRF